MRRAETAEAGGGRRSLLDWAARWGWPVWGAVILVVSVVPVGWVFGFAPQETWSAGGSAGHFAEFGLFAALVAIAWRRRRPARSGLAAGAAAAIAYGGAIEIVQIPIPYRSGDWRDFAVDIAGTAVGLGILMLARRWSARRPRGALGAAAERLSHGEEDG